jgi:hypothetical protein
MEYLILCIATLTLAIKHRDVRKARFSLCGLVIRSLCSLIAMIIGMWRVTSMKSSLSGIQLAIAINCAVQLIIVIEWATWMVFVLILIPCRIWKRKRTKRSHQQAASAIGDSQSDQKVELDLMVKGLDESKKLKEFDGRNSVSEADSEPQMLEIKSITAMKDAHVVRTIAFYPPGFAFEWDMPWSDFRKMPGAKFVFDKTGLPFWDAGPAVVRDSNVIYNKDCHGPARF